MHRGEGGGRGRPDRADPAPNRAQVAPARVQTCEKILHAIGAGEQQPVVFFEPGNGLIERSPIAGRADFNRWQLDRIRPKLAQLLAHFGGLLARPRDNHGSTEQRQTLKPGELFVHVDNIAHDDQGRRPHLRFLDSLLQRRDRACDRFLPAARTPSHRRRGRIGRAPRGDEMPRDFAKYRQAHEDDQRLGVAQAGPVHAGHVMAGQKCDG